MFQDLLPADDLTVGYFHMDFIVDQPEWKNVVDRVKALCGYLIALLQREKQHKELRT